MNDALRMDNDGNARHFNVEEPARFDHLEPFVEQRGRIDGDLPAHDPGRMLERAFDGNLRKFFFGPLGLVTKRPAAGREPELADGRGRFAVEALEDGGMLAVKPPASVRKLWLTASGGPF